MKRLAILIFLIVPVALFAVEPDEMLQDPVLELRAREISKQLRCVVCQNQDIDSSNAGVARDLRIIVRERLVAGDSNEQAIDYIHARYGDFVLMRPPFNASTAVLWFAPVALALAAFLIGWLVLTANRKRQGSGELSDAEEAEIARFIAQNEVSEES